jgi:hypothetical protein
MREIDHYLGLTKKLAARALYRHLQDFLFQHIAAVWLRRSRLGYDQDGAPRWRWPHRHGAERRGDKRTGSAAGPRRIREHAAALYRAGAAERKKA